MRKITSIAAAAVLTMAGTSLAQYPPTAASPLQPATPAAGPTAANPATASPPVAVAGARVEVFAFDPVGTTAGNEWVGRGIQASLQSDVSRSGASLVLGKGTDGADPVAIARANGAAVAVTGTYQVENGQVRADGHVIDTATGQAIGGFSGRAATGSVFQLEDALGEQVRHLLPPPPMPAAANGGQFTPVSSAPGAYQNDGTPTQPPPQQPPPQQPQSTTVVVTSPPAYADSAQPAANYYAGDYAYPAVGYAGYGYPYSYPYGYYGVYNPFVFGFYGGVGLYGRYGHGYGYGYGYGRGYGYGTGRGYGYGGGRGYAVGVGGGRSYSGVGFGGGFHGGGGGHR